MNACGHLGRLAKVTTGDGGRPVVAAVTTAIVAWAGLVVVARTPLAFYLSHDVLDRASVAVPLAVAGYAAGWLLMVAAMMLPVAVVLERSTERFGPWLAGYLGAWLLAGFAFAWLDLVLHAVVVVVSTGGLGAALRAGVGAGGAGLSLLVAWRSAPHPSRLPAGPECGRRLASGWLHGVDCLRTCGPMMLAVQAVAPGDLGVMALAAGGLAVVRLLRRRSEFSPVAA